MFTFRLCKGCHPKLSSIYETAQGSLSKSQSMYQKKVPVKWIVSLYVSIENNKCLNNPN